MTAFCFTPPGKVYPELIGKPCPAKDIQLSKAALMGGFLRFWGILNADATDKGF